MTSLGEARCENSIPFCQDAIGVRVREKHILKNCIALSGILVQNATRSSRARLR